MRSSSRRNIVQKVTALLTMLAFNASTGNALAEPSQNEGTSLHRSVSMRAKRTPIANSAISGSVVARSIGRPINLPSQNHSLRARQTETGNYLQSFDAKTSGMSNRDISTHAQTLSYSKLPMSFEPNVGQAERDARFLAHGKGYTLLLKGEGPELLLRKRNSGPRMGVAPETNHTNDQLSLKFVGANPQTVALGQEELSGQVNYFVGNDPSQWRTNIPTYRRVKFQNIYPGVDVAYYGTQQQLEFDVVLAPRSNPDAIQFVMEGADNVTIAANGDLISRIPDGEIRQKLPSIYQDIHGTRRHVVGGYVIKDGNRVAFKLAKYDRDHELVIDPILLYATY